MSDEEQPDAIEREERAIYFVLALAGIPVLLALAIDGGTIDAGATISLACVVLATIGAYRLFARRPRLPKAQQLSHPTRRASGNRRPPR